MQWSKYRPVIGENRRGIEKYRRDTGMIYEKNRRDISSGWHFVQRSFLSLRFCSPVTFRPRAFCSHLLHPTT